VEVVYGEIKPGWAGSQLQDFLPTPGDENHPDPEPCALCSLAAVPISYADPHADDRHKLPNCDRVDCGRHRRAPGLSTRGFSFANHRQRRVTAEMGASVGAWSMQLL
jgi:hypothetical protein